MRSQISIDTIMSTLRTTAEDTYSTHFASSQNRYIPLHEQDGDLYRYVVPERDPVTQMRGSEEA
jgi:hypothetical protein